MDHVRLHGSRMCTAFSSSRPGGSLQGTPPGLYIYEPIVQTSCTPQTMIPHRTGLGTLPGTIHTPPGTRHTPSVDRMTDMCKHITLPQTSFAGGKYIIIREATHFDTIATIVKQRTAE